MRKEALEELKNATAIVDSTPTVPDASLSIFKGAINEEFEIEMQLIFEGQNIRGSYFYTKNKEALPVKGVLKEDGSMDITVYEITTEAKEFFLGKLEGNVFTGEWFTVDAGSAKLPFKLEKQVINAVENSKLTGTYEATVGNFTPTLLVEFTEGNAFKFQMILRFGQYCSGDVDGMAYFHDDKTANFYGEDNCYIQFQLGDGKITVTEADCDYYHGFKCEFTGEYKKVSEEVNWLTLDELLEF